MLFIAGLKVNVIDNRASCVCNSVSVGKTETKVEKLRSIMAQLEYTYQINQLSSKGIPFKEHLYVPEVHPITKVEFCEREDEAHVFKVCAYE